MKDRWMKEGCGMDDGWINEGEVDGEGFMDEGWMRDGWIYCGCLSSFSVF